MTAPADTPRPLSAPALAAILFAALAGCAAVALGALAAHGLDDSVRALAEIAARYAMWHALAMIAAALVLDRTGRGRTLILAALTLFAIGIVLFSGGLTALTFGIDTRTAPLGGMAFMAGWIALALAAVRALLRR